jgi:hypothetical protein
MVKVSIDPSVMMNVGGERVVDEDVARRIASFLVAV